MLNLYYLATSLSTNRKPALKSVPSMGSKKTYELLTSATCNNKKNGKISA